MVGDMMKVGARKKKMHIALTVDEVTYEKFKAFVEREGYIRIGDFFRDFIRRYVECNEKGVTWVIDLKSGLIDREKLKQQFGYVTKELARYLSRCVEDIFDQVIAEVERRLKERADSYVL
jgi:hypothetical protein